VNYPPLKVGLPALLSEEKGKEKGETSELSLAGSPWNLVLYFCSISFTVRTI
jgi:hypothetical protein